MQKYLAQALACSVFALSACGGGGSSSYAPVTVPSPTPTPTPTVTPTPTPSPTPSATYTAFDAIATDTAFDTSCFGSASPTPGAPSVKYTDPTFGKGLSISYQANSQSYVVAGNGFSTEFGPADLESRTPLVYRIFPSNGLMTTFSLEAKSAAYTRVATLVAQDLAGLPYQLVRCVLGVPTQATDMPTVTINYSADLLIGYVHIDGTDYDLSASTANATYDPATASLSFDIALAGKATSGTTTNPPPDTIVNIGSVQSATTTNVAPPSVFGSLASTAFPNFDGNFGGAFFGPGGLEAGLVVRFTGTKADGSAYSGAATLLMRKKS